MLRRANDWGDHHITLPAVNCHLFSQEPAGATKLGHEALLSVMIDPPLPPGPYGGGGSSYHGVHLGDLPTTLAANLL